MYGPPKLNNERKKKLSAEGEIPNLNNCALKKELGNTPK
jgi:hypothetical protein